MLVRSLMIQAINYLRHTSHHIADLLLLMLPLKHRVGNFYMMTDLRKAGVARADQSWYTHLWVSGSRGHQLSVSTLATCGGADMRTTGSSRGRGICSRRSRSRLQMRAR